MIPLTLLETFHRQDKKGLKRDTRKFLCDVDHHNLRAARKEALELAADEDVSHT